ncbi:MAG: winged helix-turn-helix domain-containing protein [Myxococcota bacterium]
MNEFTTVSVERGRVDLRARTLGDQRLSPTEARLLGFLAARPGEVVSKEALLEQVWQMPPDASPRTVFATIERLRRKVERDPRHPRHVVTVGRDGYSFVPLPAAPEAAPSDLVGRDAEREQLRTWLAAPGARVTLRGPGGVGKSRLAREVDGPVWFVPLEGADDVLQAVARALQVVADPDPDRATARIARVARGGVLVLDGAERLVDAVAALVQRLDGPRVLVTSRVALGVPGERVLTLAPLADDDAVALFLQRARLRRPGWSPDAEQAAQIRALVAALDGLPLAVEVAASWVAVLDPDAILARLTHVLARPSGPRTVDDALWWSWDALDRDDQDGLLAAATFRSPFPAAAAEEVLGPDGLARLDALEARSLVRADGARRFELLHLVRAFAEARAAEAPARVAAARARHAAYFAEIARALLEELERGGPRATHHAVAAVQADLEALLDAGTPEQAALAALALGVLHKDLGPVDRWLAVVERASARPGVPPALAVRLGLSRATALRYVGRASEAGPALEALRAAVEADAPDRRWALALGLGTLALQSGDLEAARAQLEAARAGEDAFVAAAAEAELGTIAWRGHRLGEAAGRYRAALAAFRRLGARHAEAVYLGNLGVVDLSRGRTALAREAFTEALALQRALGSVRFEVQLLTNLGILALREGDAAQARARYAEALLAERSGDRRDEDPGRWRRGAGGGAGRGGAAGARRGGR